MLPGITVRVSSMVGQELLEEKRQTKYDCGKNTAREIIK